MDPFEDRNECQTDDQIEDQYGNDGEEIICQPDILFNHQNEKKNSNESESGKFPCRKCNKTFSSKFHARRHEKRSCKGELTYQYEKILSDKNGRYPCENCDQTFSTSSHMRRHQKKSCKSRFTDQNEKILSNEKENIICQPDIAFPNFEFITSSTNEIMMQELQKGNRVKKETVHNTKKIKKEPLNSDPLA